ncbi:hypothetical protein BCR44DRAFT_1483190 [Catenaria anguillulae PL171]|uniref:Uncharacterized protein n=1 Tax=Catenaria anguillulae PL171 TaxID=765915 RepID=A0A1Y2HWF0_9FUNG|nr:hypothetical protein BCR44DRAFT_1483190 [Catenaria anguillulae PL171]
MMDPQSSSSSQQPQHHQHTNGNSNTTSAPASSGSGSSHARRLSNPLMAFLSSSSSSASAPTSPHRASQPHPQSNQSHAHPQARQTYQQMLRHLRYPNHDHDQHSHMLPADSDAGMLMYDDGDQDSHDDMDPDAHGGGGDDEDDMPSDPELMMVGDDDEDEASGMLGLFGFGGFASGAGAGTASPAKRNANGGGRPISGSSNESQPTNTSSSWSSSAAMAGLGPLRTVATHDSSAVAALPPATQLAAAALTSGAGNSTLAAGGVASSSFGAPQPATVPVAAGIAVLGGPFPALRDWIIVTASQLPLPTITNLGQVNENTINWLNPIVYLQLLTYPAGAPVVEGGPPAASSGSQGNLAQRSGSGSKASFSVLRETHLVRQRRRLITMLSTYTIIMRYCSFDAFIVLLVLSTCLLLYFMKNSRKINVQMAKRNIKQRVGWAKQWAGGLFKRNNGNANAGVDDGEGNFMGSVEGAAAFGHESSSAAAAGVSTGASPNVTSEKKRRRGIPGFKKSNSPGNSSNMIAMSAGPNASQTMLAPPGSSTTASASSGAPPNVGSTAAGGSSNGGSGAAAAAKAAAGARRINNLFRRAASVEPTGDKINPFHADGSANMAAVMGSAGLHQGAPVGSAGQPQLHRSHSGSNQNLGVSTAPAATSAASSTSSAPASASVTGSMSAALSVPTTTAETGMHASGSVEVGSGVSHATGGGSGTGGKLSKIFSRRRGNSSAPANSAASSPASAAASHPTGGTSSPIPPATDADSSSGHPPGSVRGLSNDTLTNPIPPALHTSHSSALSSNDTLATHPNPMIVHTHTSTQPITVLSDPSSSAPVAWSPRTSAHHSVSQLHGTPIMPTSISHDSISGLVSLGTNNANANSGSNESVQSNSSGSSSGTSKRLGGLQGHARSSSDGQYAVLPPAPGRTLTNASTASSSGSVKSGGRIAAAVVGKAKDLWGHVKGGSGSGGGSGGTTPTDGHASAVPAPAHASRSGSLTEVATATASECPVAPPQVQPQQYTQSLHAHPLPALPPRKPSFAGTPLVASPGSVEEHHGALRKTPSRTSVGNVAAATAASDANAGGVTGGNDLHTPAPSVPQV